MSRPLPLHIRNEISARRAFLSRGLSAQPRDREAEAVESFLSARRFHGRALTVLAKPRRFAKVARCLERATGAALLEILWAPIADNVRLFRLAVACGAVEADCGKVPRFSEFVTVDELCEKSDDEGAIQALAAFGVCPDWARASRRVRAAYALNRLVIAFRRPAS